MPNRWLGRPPRNHDELERLRLCCDSAQQCTYCPFRTENRHRSLKDLAQDGLLDGL